MSNSWDKVRSFLDTMEIQDLYSSVPSTYASSSSLLSYSSCVHPLPLGAESWLVGEKTIKQILGVIQPTVDSEKRRREIIEYLQTLIEGSFGVKVFVFGSVPLKTYLPHGDIDLTVVSRCDTGQDLASDIHSLLLIEMANNTKFQVRDVIYVPAQVKVIKCSVSNTPVDISFNQTAGLSALYLLEQVDQYVGRNHLFKHSVILIKAWCYYESRLLGGYYGLLSTYALETLVLHLINNFHSSLHCPLAVLYKFLEYFSKFDWERYCVAVNGFVSISSLPEITVQRPDNSDELLVTEEFLRNFREAFLFSTRGSSGAKTPTFSVKFLNIVDPLRDDNNLGRSVGKGNFYRFRSALAYGTEKLSEVLTLPPEKIFRGLEKFFINTLERNGKTNLADVPIRAPAYDTTQGFETEDIGDLLSGIEYDLWFNRYGTISPGQLSSWAAPQGWSNEWAETGQNMAFDQDIYYDMDESLLISSIGSPTCFQLNSAVYEEQMGLARGTGLYIPHLEHLIQRRIHLAASLEGLQKEEEKETKEEEESEEAKSVESTEFYTPKGDNSSDDSSSSSSCLVVLDYSLEEFPLLPGSKSVPIPVPTKGTQPEPTKLEKEVNNSGAYASEDPSTGLELESLKCSSPMSVPLSELGKQSEFSVSAILKPLDEPSVGDKQEASKTEEKPEVMMQLKDENEFPPLSSARPARPQLKIRYNKKEFPPLGMVVKSEKKGQRKQKNSKEAAVCSTGKKVENSQEPELFCRDGG